MTAAGERRTGGTDRTKVRDAPPETRRVRVRRLGVEDVALAGKALRSLKGAAPADSSGGRHLRPFLARPENVLIVAEED
jgi:hypothetical protein